MILETNQFFLLLFNDKNDEIMSFQVSEAEYSHCYLASPHLIGTCDNSSQQVKNSLLFPQKLKYLENLSETKIFS